MQETNFIQWIILAIIQGLTEYLPVSSSAHLILTSQILGFKDQGLIMDVAAHGGSLMAVMWYFKDELAKLFKGNNWSLFFKLLTASVPLALFGVIFADTIEKHLRDIPLIIAASSIVFGILLYLADLIQRKSHKKNKTHEIGLKQSILIGCAQVLALIPGASRSGVTMTAAMAMGHTRTKAAQFSFLLAIPALLMTTAYGFLKIYNQPTEYNVLGIATVLGLSFFSSLLSIRLFLKLIERIPISAFMWYRILLAFVIFWIYI